MAVPHIPFLVTLVLPILIVLCDCQSPSHPAWHLNFICFFAQYKDFLPDQSYMLPAYEIAMREIRQQYNVNASLSIISAPFLKSCDDLQNNWYLVAEYYYRTWLPHTSLSGQIPILFLNGCDEGNEVGRLTREWNILTIATAATPSNQPRQREFYPTLVSFATFESTVACQGILTILAHFGWTTVYIVYDTWMKNYYHALWPAVAGRVIRDSFSSMENAQFNIIATGCNSSGTMPYESLLAKAMNISRVIMIMFRGEEMRNFMMAAAKLSMLNGEYIFLTAEPFDNARRFGALSWYRNDSDDMTAKHAFRYVMKFTTTFKQRGSNSEKDALAREVKERGIIQYGAWYADDERPNPGPLAAYMAVKALGRIVSESSDTEWTSNATYFAQKFHRQRFWSRGLSVTVDASGVRVPVIYLEDFNPDTESFETAVIYEMNSNRSHPVTMAENYSIDWATFDNLPPWNIPLCGYRADAGPCASSLIGGVLKPLLISIILLVIIFFAVSSWYLRKKGTRDVGKWWILDAQHICQGINSLAGDANRKRLSVVHATETRFHVELHPDYVYKNTPVVVKKLPVQQKFSWNRFEEDQLKKLTVMDHGNLVRLYGFVVQSDELWCVYEFLAKGHLKDLVTYSHMDWDFCMLLAYDLIKGVRTVHRSVFKQHGYISPSVCMISKNLTLKLADCGLFSITVRHFAVEAKGSTVVEEDLSQWFAPEIRPYVPVCRDLMEMAKFATCEADVYSVASIILWIFKPCQKSSDDSGCTEILKECSSDCPGSRGSIEELWKFFRGRLHSGGSLIETLIRKMDNYARKLEDVVKERTVHLQREKQLTESLLLEMLPKSILQRLLTGQSVVPEVYPSVTVGFSTFDGFTGFVAVHSPLQVVKFLGDVFSLFDDHSVGYDVYKVESISDCYMVVSGLPIPNGIYHAAEVCTLAVSLRNMFMCEFFKTGLQMMIGIHSGECAAGLVGTQRPRYCLFGDTVNMASRLASHSTGFNIQTTVETVQLLPRPSQINISERGLTELKGFERRVTFWVDLMGDCRQTEL